MTQPNILFLMTDQQRWDALSCARARGGARGWVRTPHLDRIAAEGVCFSRCVTNSPVCIPMRVSLATGHYPHNTRIWGNLAYDMPSQTPTWMQAIRDAGYRTSLFGKTHLHRHTGDLRDREHLLHAYGLDDVDEIGGPRASARVLSHMTARWQAKGLWEAYQQDYEERFRLQPHMVRPSALPLSEYADVYVGQRAAGYLRAYDHAQPWFCWVSFGGPHEPWDAPEPYASMYDPQAMPAPVPCPAQGRCRPRGVLDERLAQAPRLDPDDVAAMRANYAGKVTLIDDQIGHILQVVEDRGEWDNTAIAFVSDHGEMNGDYGLLYKSNFLNGAVRVPLILRTPGTARSAIAGQVHDGPVESFDLGPTLVELAGGALQHRHFGRSLRAQLSDPTLAHRDAALSEIRGEIMILNERYKMALNRQGQPYLLYDLQQDPDETHNLAGLPEMQALETELRLRILERMVGTQIYEP
jgi:choline-sulfatase